MDWDLGLNGLLYLAAMSLATGVLAHVLAGHGVVRWFWAAVSGITFVVGIVFSEVFFGWATEEDLQPNIDGLSRDEALLGAFLVLVAAVVTARWRARHTDEVAGHGGHTAPS